MIHLTPDAGEVYVGLLLSQSEKFFGSGVISIDLTRTEPDEAMDQDPESRLAQLEGRIKALELKGSYDNLVMARFREELDEAANKAKESRIVITGLTCTTPAPLDP